MGLKWYQTTAYDLPISRLVFLYNLKSLGLLYLKKLFSAACLVNVACAANCVVAERYIRYTCDHGMVRYGITVETRFRRMVISSPVSFLNSGTSRSTQAGRDWRINREVQHAYIIINSL
jgi:hypothetical protein